MGTGLTFRLILAALFVAFIGHRAYYTRKYPPSAGATIEARPSSMATRIADLLSVPALLSTATFIIFPGWIGWSYLPFPAWLRWAGVGAGVLGFVLLQWSHLALGSNWSDHPRIIGSQELVTSGPYRWIRHPIYTAFLIILGSTLLITSNWLVGGLWILATSIDIYSRIDYEEQAMRARFGEAYIAYQARTGRLLPRI